MPDLYGYSVDAMRAEATIDATFDSPLSFPDTSNNNGGGSAEERIGAVLRRRGGLPAGIAGASVRTRSPTLAWSAGMHGGPSPHAG
jgi:D-threo-aldose 1-dehydrogenase